MTTMLILIRWQLRQLFWINILTACCCLIFALFSTAPITFLRGELVMLGVLVHCVAMVLLLGRSDPRGPGFLYAQGLSRDQLWWSTFAATLISGLLICLCFWLTVVSGLRALVQETAGNPWFPAAGSIDAKSAKWFLMEYALLLPPLHYVWVRARQPKPDAAAGWTLAGGAVLYYCCCQSYYLYAGENGPTSCVVLTSAAVLLGLVSLGGSWIFHRHVEVQS